MEAEEMVTQLRTLIEAGTSLRAAGFALGVSATTAYRRIAPLGEQVARRRRRPLLATDRRRIIHLAEEGETSIRRIAAHVGRSWHTVARVVSSRDVPRLALRHRCPTCGHTIVVQPCLICRARQS